MEFGQTRDFSEFCEQLNEVRVKFQKWDSCEKTVALFYLMVGLPFSNARFLQNALDQLVKSISSPETQILERHANDCNVISSFLKENPQMALCLLLNHLPMLKPGNREAARCYLNTIRRILTEFIAPPFKKIYNECVEIMSYVYIHPAFDKEDKTSFKHLLKQVLNKVSPENFIHSPVNESSDECVSPNPEFYTTDKRRCNSLTPAMIYGLEADNWSSQENLTPAIAKPRSYSLSCDKTTTESGSGIQLSSSETKLQEIMLKNSQPLMKSILSWLKSLRLHKYSWIFHNLTTHQMLNLSEDYLIEVGVTKGARQKLLLSLQRLTERSAVLAELEVDIRNGGDIYDTLKKLKVILQSPLQLSLGEDLPSQFVRVMGKVCSQLLMLRQPSDESLVLFNTLCEKADNVDSFTTEQRRKLNMWKEQLDTGNVLPLCAQRQGCYRNLRIVKTKYPAAPSPQKITFEQSSYAPKSSSYPNVDTNQTVIAHRHSVDSVTLKNQLSRVRPELDSCSYFSNSFHKTSGLGPSKKHESINKTSFDIESSLESLCLQMMEHALGP
ncbi:protein Smaug homolog 2 [Cylas formicarius]|uniref:protein Smaug homolog 2 n=1 Tax=Cylas formicarius TaxID=197179 RepID=UPI002958D43A|nr:protein Smaug homolog 2 [Cylas formicarius]